MVHSFTIKGQPGDDAVLCTADKTYSLRSVVLSNSVLVVTSDDQSPSSSDCTDVVIRDQLNEFLELVPSIPRLHKLDGFLKGMEYDEGQDENQFDNDDDRRPVSVKLS
jgi:sister chromatid cohesion protein DCC1